MSPAGGQIITRYSYFGYHNSIYPGGFGRFWTNTRPKFGIIRRVRVRGAFLCISYRGKLLQHTLIVHTSTRVPVSPVPSTGIRFKKVKIIKTYNPYTKILNFVLLIWEERNSGRYEHARACRERVRAPRALQKIHQPSIDIILYARSYYV